MIPLRSFCFPVYYIKMKKIKPVVLYGYETWSLTLNEKLGESGWRRLRNEELHVLLF
jgi:hypothetical protein